MRNRSKVIPSSLHILLVEALNLARCASSADDVSSNSKMYLKFRYRCLYNQHHFLDIPKADMSQFIYGGRRATPLLARQSRSWLNHRHASRISIPTPPPFPVIEACPAPSCQCAEMPSGLEIDHELPLNGTMASYAEQVLISTGRSDWKSKIEDDEYGVFYRQLRKYLLKDGKYSDVRAPALRPNTC